MDLDPAIRRAGVFVTALSAAAALLAGYDLGWGAALLVLAFQAVFWARALSRA